MKKTLALALVWVLICLASIGGGLAEFEQVQSGSKGTSVAEIQSMLNSLGYDCGTADGQFGKKTEDAVKDFQADNGLDVTGIVGEGTYAALLEKTSGDTTTAEEQSISETASPTSLPPQTESPADEATVQESDTDFPVINEYQWDSYGTYYYGLAIKNASGHDTSLTVNLIFYDADGKMIGVAEDQALACENGYESFFMFSNEAAFDHVTYEIEEDSSMMDYIKCCQSALTIESSPVGNKAIISIANNGDTPISSIDCTVLFLDDSGNVIAYDWIFVMDLDAGKTALEEAHAYDDFSTVSVYANTYIS